MWAYESVFYQIYPMGFCGAPWENDGKTVNRIEKVGDWAAHIASVGCNAVYFSPVFESDSHGYDTRDFRKIDCRLGTNKDFAEVCGKLHKEGVRIVLDGVFNHVGRGFWAFKDVQEKKWDSPYKDWFHISFDGNSNYNDGFWYEGWEGHYELVKLNLRNEEVIQHIFDCIRGWVEEFDIDGLRLDVGRRGHEQRLLSVFGRRYAALLHQLRLLQGFILLLQLHEHVRNRPFAAAPVWTGAVDAVQGQASAVLCRQSRCHPRRIYFDQRKALAAYLRDDGWHAGHPVHLLRQ